MITHHLGTVLRLDSRLVRGGYTRVEAHIGLGGHDMAIGSDQMTVSTLDPFAQDTLKAAKDSGRKAWIEVAPSEYGYTLISVELGQ